MTSRDSQQQLLLDVPFKNICGKDLMILNSLIGWMQERRLLPQDWVTKLKAAQIKSEELRLNYPVNHNEEAVRNIYKTLILGKQTDEFLYRDAKQVFHSLVDNTDEGKQKNFIGRYKSQLVIDWQLLLRIYEKDNLYLAEYGKIV